MAVQARLALMVHPPTQESLQQRALQSLVSAPQDPMRQLHETINNKPDSAHTLQMQWLRTIGIYLAVQAVIGIIGIEYAWARTRRFREDNELRDGRFPWFRRWDARHWTRAKLYPGAIFTMPTRLALLVINGAFLAAVVTILSIGHDFKKGPLKNGCRKWVILFMYHVGSTVFLFVAGMQTSLHYQDVDYSYYLGDNYKSSMRKIKRTSTIVCNHVSWLDAVILIKNVRPAFAASAEFANVPLLTTLINTIDSIYIPRGGSDESKAKALRTIRDRQELIEVTGMYAPFLIFAEAGTSNGTSVIQFKKGAFFAEKTIRPMFLKYSPGTVSPAYDVMEFLPLAILQLSWACMHCEVCVLPDFQPTEYLFKKHADQGKERWEVYAWALRDMMAKEGNFGICDIPMRQKIAYESYMQMQPGAVNPAEADIDPQDKTQCVFL